MQEIGDKEIGDELKALLAAGAVTVRTAALPGTDEDRFVPDSG